MLNVLIVLTALIAFYYFISVLPLQLALNKAFKKIEEQRETKPKGEMNMSNQQAIIRTEVQVTPQIHQGAMQHYWRVFQIDAQGNNFTLHDGWQKQFLLASDRAYGAARKYL